MHTRYRGHIVFLALSVLLIGGAHAAAAKSKGRAAAKVAVKPDPQVVASSFETFCDQWMQKLAVRERDNISNLKWEPDDGGVKGTYVGYEQEHTCKLVEGTEGDPVAKVFYREIHYSKHGTTVAEAEQCSPKPVEIFEVQEIFHYLKGKWDY